MEREKKIAALVLDLGGVLLKVDWGQSLEVFRQEVPDFSSELARWIYEWEVYDSFERGHVGVEEFFEAFSKLTGLKRDLPWMIEGWNRMLVNELPGVASLVRELADSIPLYALTNANTVHMDHVLRSFPVVEYFQKIYSSHELGFRKPQPEIYQAVVKDLKVDPSGILFIDDLPANVEGARAVGLHGEKCRNSPDLLRAIAGRYGIL